MQRHNIEQKILHKKCLLYYNWLFYLIYTLFRLIYLPIKFKNTLLKYLQLCSYNKIFNFFKLVFGYKFYSLLNPLKIFLLTFIILINQVIAVTNSIIDDQLDNRDQLLRLRSKPISYYNIDFKDSSNIDISSYQIWKKKYNSSYDQINFHQKVVTNNQLNQHQKEKKRHIRQINSEEKCNIDQFLTQSVDSTLNNTKSLSNIFYIYALTEVCLF